MFVFVLFSQIFHWLVCVIILCSDWLLCFLSLSQWCQLREVAAEFRAGERVYAAAGRPHGTQAAAAFSATGRVDVCQ